MSSLQKVVDEMKQLFPDTEESIIKQVLIDCNYDKNECANLLFLAQESGIQTIPNYSAPPADHHNDVTLVYEDKIVTVKKDELVGTNTTEEVPKKNTLNEEYKKAAEEDELAYANGDHLPQQLLVEKDSRFAKMSPRKRNKKNEKKDALLQDEE